MHMMYNTGYMTGRKLRQTDFDRPLVRESFGHLRNAANLSSQGKMRVAEAMKAAVAHVEKKRGLQHGMQGQHVGMALDFLGRHYEGRHDLEPKEREIIEKSFKSHFNIKDTPPPEVANDDNHREAA